MRTKPITYNHSRPAEAIGISAGIARRIGARLLHELLEVVPRTIFFFVGFNFVELTSNLLVAQYLIGLTNFMLATVAALVVGKAVLVASCGRSFSPPIHPSCSSIQDSGSASSYGSAG
jgi:hypothetical protein